MPKTPELASVNIKRAFPSWHTGTAHPGPPVPLAWAESWPRQPFAILWSFQPNTCTFKSRSLVRLSPGAVVSASAPPGWCDTRGTCCLRVLGARSPGSRCLRAGCSQGLSRPICSRPSRCCWHPVLAVRLLLSHDACVSSCKGTDHCIWGPSRFQDDLILTNDVRKDPLSC